LNAIAHQPMHTINTIERRILFTNFRWENILIKRSTQLLFRVKVKRVDKVVATPKST